ncbi:MAG: zinc dependent phospholipase C family protein, partial [Bacteroidia bacterium]
MRRFFPLIIIVLLLIMPLSWLFSWGFFAHRRINYIAVFTLPPEMVGFYKSNIDFLSENAVNPDKRRYATKDEAPRHYIDIDHYAVGGIDPFEAMPKKWEDAVAKYSEDTLMAHGIVPWHIARMTLRLADAFREKNVDRILYLSADLGHYIADAHVPLHVTKNYNGQLTNQIGIHGFWESRLPELYSDNYDFFTGRATFISDPLEEAWEIVKQSFSSVDSVLLLEKEISKSFPEDKKYAIEQRGASTMRVYSEEFSRAYHEALNGMVERRMRDAIIKVGSYWMTAWVMAGQPDLYQLLDKKVTDEMKKQMAEEEKMWRTGQAPKGREHDDH